MKCWHVVVSTIGALYFNSRNKFFNQSTNNKKIILTGLLTAVVSTSALADTSSWDGSSGSGLIINEWVKAGVNANTGTLGSGGNTSPGLLFDPSGTSTFNPSYDYLTPGSPFDGFSVKVDGSNYTNNNTGITQIGLTVFEDRSNELRWTGRVADNFQITNTYRLDAGKPYIDISTEILMEKDAEHVWFAKFIDPDSQGMPGDSSSTDNVLGYGVIPSTNVAFSEATVSRYALGLYSTDTNVAAGINGWNTQADSYVNADASCGVGVLYCNADDTIGLSWHWVGVQTGDILTARYAYIFGPSAFDAASAAITGGAGGGDTTTTSSWGTLTDVGSATDSAGGGSTPVITTGTIVNTSLPVLEATLTHHEASDNGKVQTIVRELTTTTTTPMRTVTYTDGVETSSVAAPSVIVTTVTDPGSFVGRIDQIATANNMLSVANRTLNFDGVNLVSTIGNMNNGMTGGVNGITMGGTKDLESGWNIGVGAGKLYTRVRDVGSADVDTTLVNLRAGRSIEIGAIDLSLVHAMHDYTGTRTIGDFANSLTTKGTDTWINLNFVGNGEKIRPVLGVTRGVRRIDGYSEAGSIQSARTVADLADWYTFGTIGAQLVLKEGIVAQALHHTDGVNSFSLAINKEIAKDTTLKASLLHNTTQTGNVDSIIVGLVKKF